MGTIMESKEECVLELFFENPTRQWHFEEILREAKITRSKADRWLKQFLRNELIKKVKQKGKMPYYLGNSEFPAYRNKKRIFALNKLYESGLLNRLYSLKKAKTVIIFGSYSRSDWYKDSDIDIFIYGNAEGFKVADYEFKLRRDIQLFVCKNHDELSKYGSGLIKNIIKGNLIKGDLDFIKVNASG